MSTAEDPIAKGATVETPAAGDGEITLVEVTFEQLLEARDTAEERLRVAQRAVRNAESEVLEAYKLLILKAGPIAEKALNDCLKGIQEVEIIPNTNNGLREFERSHLRAESVHGGSDLLVEVAVTFEKSVVMDYRWKSGYDKREEVFEHFKILPYCDPASEKKRVKMCVCVPYSKLRSADEAPKETVATIRHTIVEGHLQGRAAQ